MSTFIFFYEIIKIKGETGDRVRETKRERERYTETDKEREMISKIFRETEI